MNSEPGLKPRLHLAGVLMPSGCVTGVKGVESRVHDGAAKRDYNICALCDAVFPENSAFVLC